jgi:murein L,D-transpeptidase YcbB/YkuD
MQKDWFVNDQQADYLNSLAAQNDMTTLRAQAGLIGKNILTALNRGYITPDKVGEKTNVKTKKVDAVLLQNELTKFAAGTITASQLFDTFRPKNSIYSRALNMYRKIVSMKQNNQIMPTPATLSIIKPGTKDQATIMFARQRLAMFGYANDTANATYTEDLKIAIEALQENNLLKLDGVIGKNSFGLLNTPVDQIITRLKINLDRSRWLPDNLSAEYVHINLAAQRLFYYKNSAITLSFKTANGRVQRPTPIMFDAINHMRLNPTWTVPRTIYFKDKGKLFATDPQHAYDMNYHFFDLRTNPPTEVQVTDIDWVTETSDARFNSGAGMNYRIVQYPDGDKNALGWIKFPMNRNALNIYMHDTNTRVRDFARNDRMISSGCIRMEKPFELAEKLLAGQVDPLTGLPVHTVASLQAETMGMFPRATVETKRNLGREIPVYVLYETTQINDVGQMTLVADPYGVDMDMYNLMTSGTLTPGVIGAN